MSAFSKWFFYISFCIGLESQRFTTTLLNGKNNQICLFSVLQCWARFDQSSIDFIAISSTKWSLMNFLNELCLSSPLHCAFQFIWRLLKNRLFFHCLCRWCRLSSLLEATIQFMFETRSTNHITADAKTPAKNQMINDCLNQLPLLSTPNFLDRLVHDVCAIIFFSLLLFCCN